MLASKESALSLVDEFLRLEGIITINHLSTEEIPRDVYYKFKIDDLGIDEETLVDLTEFINEQLDLELEPITKCKTINDICNRVRTYIRYKGRRYV